MRNRFTLFLMLMLLMGTGMNAQNVDVVARMQTLAGAAQNSDATKATASTVWKSDKEGGAVYEFSNGKYLGAISNTAVVNALEGNQYVTIAMWVYGRTTGHQCVFGYGNVNDGVKFQQNGKYISATRKGRTDIERWGPDDLLDDEWNLIAFAVAGKTNTTANTGRYYINNIYTDKSGLKLSDMNTPADGNKLLAIGSGDQNTAREAYNGMIANLTVITSDELLTNDQIKTYVGTVSRIDGGRRVTINYTCANGTFSKKTYFVPNAENTVPTPDFYTNVSPATITDDDPSASYNVTCEENFPFTAGTFYKLKLREKDTGITDRYVVWNGTSANINTRKSEQEATNAGMGSYWRFERVPNTENQVRLFTNCKGKSQAVTFTDMATNKQSATLTDNGTIFMVKTGNSDYTDLKGFRLSSLTNDNHNVYDVDGTLGVWANELSKTDGGSTFTVYAIDTPQPTEVTSATCTDENGITATYSIASKGYYWNGTASDAVSAPVLPGYMAATTASITAEGALSFNYTNNYPFVVSTDNAKYFQSLKVRNDATHYVTATYNSGSFAAGTTKSSNNGIATDETKQGIMKSGWAFVKEPGTINKFRIYNEATGNLQLYLPNENDKTAATMAASGTAFVVDLQPSEFTTFTGGFTIRANENNTHALGDHGDGTLAYWNDSKGRNELNNDGSIFRVADADVWVEQVYTDFVTNSDAWVASLVNQQAASLPAYTTAKEAAATVISNNNSTNAQKMQAYRKVAQSLYTAKTNLLAEADAAQIYKLRSLTNSGDLYLNVKNNDLQGVIITQPIKYLKNQMFQLVKNETSGKYAIKCIADNSMLLNSTGNNHWDIKSTTDSETHSEYTLGNVYNGNYTISKAADNYLSPYGTCQTDGTYIIHSNITTANAWAFEPVSATDAAKGEDENYKALYELYKTYLPYKNLYVKEQAGLPGYPTSYEGKAPALWMDDQLKSAATLLNQPKSPTTEEVGHYSIMFPHVRDRLLADLVNYPEDRYFSIKNADNRGFLVYAADAPKGTETGSEEEWNYVWSTDKPYDVTNGGETTSVRVTFDASNAAHLWCFLNHTKVDGTKEHYLYNVGLKKYARPTKVVGTYGGYTWVLTDEPAPITLKIYDYLNREMAITAKSVEVASDTVVYASVNTGYTGPVISQYEPGDGSVPFTFDWGTKDFVASDTTAVAALVRTPITLRTVDKEANPLITGLDDNQSICTYSSTKAFRVPTGITAYYATRRDDNNIVRLKTVPDGIVPANEGVILVGDVNKTQAMLDVDYRTKVTAEGNIFHNTASGPTPMGANCYILAQTVEQGIGFYHATPSSTLSQGKAYLDFSSSPVRAFTLSFGDDGPTTGISSINADGNAENAPVYDLSGRRIAEPYGRGIYIKNGKKYFVK